MSTTYLFPHEGSREFAIGDRRDADAIRKPECAQGCGALGGGETVPRHHWIALLSLVDPTRRSDLNGITLAELADYLGAGVTGRAERVLINADDVGGQREPEAQLRPPRRR